MYLPICKRERAAYRQSSQLSSQNRDGCSGYARYFPNGIYFQHMTCWLVAATLHQICASRKLTSLCSCSCMGQGEPGKLPNPDLEGMVPPALEARKPAITHRSLVFLDLALQFTTHARRVGLIWNYMPVSDASRRKRNKETLEKGEKKFGTGASSLRIFFPVWFFIITWLGFLQEGARFQDGLKGKKKKKKKKARDSFLDQGRLGETQVHLLTIYYYCFALRRTIRSTKDALVNKKTTLFHRATLVDATQPRRSPRILNDHGSYSLVCTTQRLVNLLNRDIHSLYIVLLGSLFTQDARLRRTLDFCARLSILLRYSRALPYPLGIPGALHHPPCYLKFTQPITAT
ncbi:hypothetical protein F5Y11DRAFT_190767 [Daldinia sp. FL1419]|nr:hypothetical protein F5Y11DRAFT_190767 [Daldinia sp. FL1419]